MKISNKILIVVIIVIGLYAVFLVASDLNTIYYEISDSCMANRPWTAAI